MRRLSKICAAALFSLPLVGCASRIETVAPPIKAYSAAEQQELADAYPKLPPIAQKFIRDYGVQRNMARAATKH